MTRSSLARDNVGLNERDAIQTTLFQWDILVKEGVFREGTTVREALEKIGSWNAGHPGRMQDWCRSALAKARPAKPLLEKTLARLEEAERLDAERIDAELDKRVWQTIERMRREGRL